MEQVINKCWNKSIYGVGKWYKEFTKSEMFMQLPELNKLWAQNVIMAFAEGVDEFEGESPKDWDDHGIMCICPEVFLIKSIKDIDFYKSVVPVLASFFEFLEHAGYKEDGINLAKVVRAVEPRIQKLIKNCR